MKEILSSGRKIRDVRISLLFFLSLLILVAGPKTANACVFCLEHMGTDAAMYWTNDVMISMRLNYSDILVAGNQVINGGLHASQALLTQENTLQLLVTSRWMVQVTEPIYYRWNWPGNVNAGYSPGLGNNNAGFVTEPGDMWIANLLDLYDRNTFSGLTRIVLVQGVHFPTSPTLQTFNNQYINSALTGAGAYELTFGIEAMHMWSNGRWMVIGDFLNSFELPNNLGTETGDTINTDYQIEYRVTKQHSRFPETWLSFGDYIQYNSANIQVNPVTINGVTTPAGPILGTEAFVDSVGVGFQTFPIRKWSNFMVFGNADKFVYWNNPGSTPSSPNLFPDFKTILGFMLMW